MMDPQYQSVVTPVGDGLSGQTRIDAQRRLIVASEAAAPLSTLAGGTQYETVAAGQTAQVLGATGATGDYLAGLLITPAVVACGAVTILDNATSIVVFVGGGTTALADAKPFFVPIGAKSVSGAWKVTTGANVSVIASGTFT